MKTAKDYIRSLKATCTGVVLVVTAIGVAVADRAFGVVRPEETTYVEIGLLALVGFAVTIVCRDWQR